MPRTREFDPEKALDDATEIFWREGYADTSMEDIVSRTGVSRYGLYNTFGNKRELLFEAMRNYCRQLAESSQEQLRRPDAGRKEIIAYWDELRSSASEHVAKNGCLIGNIAAEVAPHDPAVAEIVQAVFEDLAGVFANAIRNGQRDGDINPDIDPDATGRMLTSLAQGLALMLRSGGSFEHLSAAADAGLKVLDR